MPSIKNGAVIFNRLTGYAKGLASVPTASNASFDAGYASSSAQSAIRIFSEKSASCADTSAPNTKKTKNGKKNIRLVIARPVFSAD